MYIIIVAMVVCRYIGKLLQFYRSFNIKLVYNLDIATHIHVLRIINIIIKQI